MIGYPDLLRLLPDATATACDVAALAQEITELALLAHVLQDPGHHAEGTVLVHTQMVIDELFALPVWRTLSERDRFVLFYGALFHDLGKILCTVVDPDGVITSRGHSRKGAIAAREILWLAEVPFALREGVCGLIATHQTPFHAFKVGGVPADYLVRRLSYQVNVELLLLLAEADSKGRLPRATGQDLEELALLRDYAEELGCLRQPYAFPDDYTRVMYFRKEGQIPADVPLPRKPGGSQVILLSGLPASGKDSWARNHGEGFPVFSYDAAREQMKLKHGKHDGGATQLVRSLVREQLRVGGPFIWNATHLSREMRGQALSLCYAYGAEVKIIYLEAPAKIIRERNKARGYTIPDEAILKMLHRWEPPLASESHQVEWWTENLR